MRVSDVTMIAVGMPFNGDEIDLTQIEDGSIAIGQALQNVDRYHAGMVKSTVVTGTTKDLVNPLLDAVMQTNTLQPQQMIALLNKREVNIARANVAVLGLAFKPGTDDVRESPALPLIDELVSAGAKVTVYDPVATHEAQLALGDLDITYATSMHEAIDGANVVMLVTAWPEFAELPNLIAPRAHQPLVIDGRRMLAADSVTNYEGIGRGIQMPDGTVLNSDDDTDELLFSAA